MTERIKELIEYHPETGRFFWKESRGNRAKGDEAGAPDGYGYICIKVDGKTYRAHRLAWYMVHGSLPKTLDHINRDPSDNRIENLRPCTQKQNSVNRKSHSNTSSRFKGVSWDKRAKKWGACIGIDYKQKFLGLYDSEIVAARAYNEAAKEYHGEFANLNKENTP